eukprot:TRINITY_DN119_c2_g1_i1.p1 TRINITY_DN119_c2_g1~~TRINITY_DN119_c2_g1_i1.p1  ORF type:complete len:288 (+),score=90.34 TRINITY_DN119_c2_g1_i1:541-1404(+)
MAEVHYTPKCYSSGNRGTCEGDSLSLRKILQDYPGKVLKCQCQRASCELKQLLREENRRPQREPKWITLEEGLKEELIRVVGGSAAYQNVYDYCQKLSLAEPQVFSRMASSQGDTVLMELCVDKKIEWRLLTAQALAFISLYEEHCPSLLFVRNSQNFCALELAALSNKGQLASYLASSYLTHSQDPNRPDPLGHTVLHKLARKGDACIDTLSELLSLRDAEHKRVLRLDIVNDGGKTPYDVATACSDLFAHDSSVSYTETLNLFQRIIYEDAEELLLMDAKSKLHQ